MEKVEFSPSNHKEDIKSFRKRFIRSFGFNSSQYNTIFATSNLGFRFPNENLTTEDICQLLIENESNIKFTFEILMCNLWKNDSEMNDRIGRMLLFYFGENSFSTPEKLLIIRGLRDVFFTGVWPQHLLIRFRRKEEETVLKELEEVSITHLEILDHSIPFHLFKFILSFLKRDRNIIISLGLVNMDWFQVVLSTWKEVTITPKNLRKIPLVVLRNVEIVNIRQPGISENDNFMMSIVDVEYISSNLNLEIISNLDLSEYHEFLETVPKDETKVKKLCLPNLTHLVLPLESIETTLLVSTEKSHQSPNLFKIFPISSFPKLRSLECTLWRLIENENLKSVLPQLHNLSVVMENVNLGQSSVLSIFEQWITLQKINQREWQLSRLEVNEILTGDGILHDTAIRIIDIVRSISPHLTEFSYCATRPGVRSRSRYSGQIIRPELLYPLRKVKFPFNENKKLDSFSLKCENDVILVEDLQFGVDISEVRKIELSYNIPRRDFYLNLKDWTKNYIKLSQIPCKSFVMKHSCADFNKFFRQSSSRKFHEVVDRIFKSLPLAEAWKISFAMMYQKPVFTILKKRSQKIYQRVAGDEQKKFILEFWIGNVDYTHNNYYYWRGSLNNNVDERFSKEVELIIGKLCEVSGNLEGCESIGVYFPKSIPTRTLDKAPKMEFYVYNY